MADEGERRVEPAVLRGPGGAIYVVPKDVMERWRVPEEVASELTSAGEVQGYDLHAGIVPRVVPQPGLHVSYSYRDIIWTWSQGGLTTPHDWP